MCFLWLLVLQMLHSEESEGPEAFSLKAQQGPAFTCPSQSQDQRSELGALVGSPRMELGPWE